MSNVVADKSLDFAIKEIKLYQQISKNKNEYVLSKQLLRSGTAIGALIREAEHAQSKKDFLNKMNVSLKEANETLYWIILLEKTDYITTEEYNSIFQDAQELVRMLAAIVKTTKANLGK